MAYLPKNTPVFSLSIIVSKGGAYTSSANNLAAHMKKIFESRYLTEPEVIADCIVKAALAPKPKTRYLLGFAARPTIMVQRIFGDRVYDSMIEFTKKISKYIPL